MCRCKEVGLGSPPNKQSMLTISITQSGCFELPGISAFSIIRPAHMLPMISRCTICCLCFLGSGIWKMLRWSLFFGVWHMEDAKMYDLLSLFFGGLAYGRC